MFEALQLNKGNLARLLPGAEILRPEIAVSPYWFGGVGNGVTDDTAAMALAIATGRAVNLSGGTWAITGVTIISSATCPGLFSDGSGQIVCASGTTSSTILFNIGKNDFYVDRIFFNLPTSTTPGSPPAVDRALYFANTGRQRVTNCRIVGGSGAVTFDAASGNSNSNVFFSDNIISNVYGTPLSVKTPNICLIQNNQIFDCGFNAATTSAVIRLEDLTYTQIGENVIISGNIIARCNQSFTQEAIDCSGVAFRNLVVADNLIDLCGYGGIEVKTNGTTGTTNVYQNWTFENNHIVLMSTQGIGIALNNGAGSDAPDNKAANVKINGNHILCESASTGTSGINVAGWTNVDIDANTIYNMAEGIQVNPDGDVSDTGFNINIRGNYIAASGAAIHVPARNTTGLVIRNNECYSTTTSALVITPVPVNDLNCQDNYFKTTAAAAIVEIRNVQGGIFKGNTLAGASATSGILFQGTACTALRITNNDVKAGAGPAFSFATASATIYVLDNTVDVPLANRIVEGAAATTPLAAGNRRLPAASDPTGSTAGSVGDIVPNSVITATNASLWTCTTAGSTSGAVWRASSALGIASISDGSSAAPSLSFAGATTSGLYMGGSNAVGLATNGKAAFLLSESGAGGNYISMFSNNTPTIVSAGAANQTLQMAANGTSGVDIMQAGASTYLLRTTGPGATTADYFTITATAASGTGPQLAVTGSDTDIDMRLAPKGAGLVRFPTASSIVANGSVATTMTSLGPTGSHTTIQEWLAIKNSAGTIRWIPLY